MTLDDTAKLAEAINWCSTTEVASMELWYLACISRRDNEPVAASCVYGAAVQRCAKTIVEANPSNGDPKHDDARYEKCV